MNTLPCGQPCQAPCPTLNPIHPACATTPTGISNRQAIKAFGGEQSCTEFAYCKDGDYKTGSCTPGQYFNNDIGKLMLNIKFNEPN